MLIHHLSDSATVLPAVNQIEGHPYLQQPGLLEWHKSKARWHPIRSCLNSAYSETQGIVTVAYSPMGNNIYNLPRQANPILLHAQLLADEYHFTAVWTILSSKRSPKS
jgi:diketogulonate reductase-like aldo/keto reductase